MNTKHCKVENKEYKAWQMKIKGIDVKLYMLWKIGSMEWKI